MSSLRLAMIQTSLKWESPAENRQAFEEYLRQIDEADLIVLPEMFTTGFTMNTEECSEPPFEETHRWMQEWAARKGAVLTGSYIVEEAGMSFNRLLWMEPDGSYEVYNKKHLFRMAGEHEHYTPGNTRLITRIGDWKILPLICYDLRFPAWCRNHYHQSTKELDYDLSLFVANWPAARSQAWDALLKSRAIENHAYSAGLNRMGVDGTGKEYVGHSGVYDPRGDRLTYSEKEEIVFIELNKKPLIDYREKFPAYLDSVD